MGFAGEQPHQYVGMTLAEQARLYLQSDGKTRSSLIFGIFLAQAVHAEYATQATVQNEGYTVEQPKTRHTGALGILERTELAATVFETGAFELLDPAEQRAILARYVFGIANVTSVYDSVGLQN
ncbi:MAG TPA: hypothetical protein VLG47_00880 [Candidatus Saccharimonadales bacterium]|nr:hypothetical protein [Candidatus Saccharimonadales bacterium]